MRDLIKKSKWLIKFRDTKRLEKAKESNKFSENIEKFSDKVIDYPDSPTGKAYVGVAKLPLMKSETGIGYAGVLIQTENRSLIQCAGCGLWYRCLTSMHLKRCSGLNHKEYRVKHGLNHDTSLISDAASEIASLRVKDGIWNLNKLGPDRKIAPKSYEHTRRPRQRMERINRVGNCPAQLKAQYLEYVEKFKEVPTTANRGQKIIDRIINKYKSQNKGLIELGLPAATQRGKYVYYQFPKEELKIEKNNPLRHQIVSAKILETIKL